MPDHETHEVFQEDGADKYKKKGNEAFKAHEWDEAIKNYTKAISLEPGQATFYSNRAASWSSKGDHISALGDANMCIELDPLFLKGYSRKGKALFDMKKFDEAEAAYKKGLDVGPDDDTCLKGISATQDAQRQEAERKAQAKFVEQERLKHARAAAGAPTGAVGGVHSFLQSMSSKFPKLWALQSSWKLTAGMLIVMAVFCFDSYIKKGPWDPWANGWIAGNGTFPEKTYEKKTLKLNRGFADVGGSWLSYLETEGEGDTLLLVLHRTSMSAEGEYASVFPEVVTKMTASPPPQGIRLLAPDRPCHGYSPCLSGGSDKGKGRDVNWLSGLLKTRASVDHLVLVASGREAGQQAFAFAKKRRDPVQIVLISPRYVAPRPKKRITSGLDLADFLNERAIEQSDRAADMTTKEVADAAVWGAAGGGAVTDQEALSGKGLADIKLPKGSTVTLFYLKGDVEVSDLTYDLALDTKDITVKTRWSRARFTTSEALIAEVWELIAPEAPAEEEDEIDDSL